jgi:hypothetical protein
MTLGLAAALTLSCAGPKKLTRQSEEALAEGEVQRAYEKARAALKKAPDSERARRALAAAAERKLGSMKERVRAVAGARDSVAAAGYCLEIDEFRREIAEFRVAPAPDAGFDREAAQIRHAAARSLVANAEEQLAAGHARFAHQDLTRARDFESAYPRLDERIREAYAQAVHRIAILPFQNQTEARGLGTDLTDAIHQEVSRGLNPRNFPYTVILPRREIRARVTLAEAEELDRSAALDLGRDLDADYVVRGRIYGLSSETTSDAWHPTVYYRHTERDSGGRSRERYDETPLEVVGLMRRVTVRCEFEIRSTRDGAVVAQHEEAMRATARVIHTGRRPEGDPDDYVLASPGLRRSDSGAAEARERDWKSHCGSWSLPELLERARKEPSRPYRPSMRSEFHSDTERKPVFLSELPPVDDLAMVALRDAWKPLLTAIRDVER